MKRNTTAYAAPLLGTWSQFPVLGILDERVTGTDVLVVFTSKDVRMGEFSRVSPGIHHSVRMKNVNDGNTL